MEPDLGVPYLDRQWLNAAPSPATGTIVAYDGPSNWDLAERHAFLEIADCHGKVRLHMSKGDSVQDFVKKMRILSEVTAQFAAYLEEKETGAKSVE